MELEAIILSKLTQEQKTKYLMFLLRSGSEMMTTLVHKKRTTGRVRWLTPVISALWEVRQVNHLRPRSLRPT